MRAISLQSGSSGNCIYVETCGVKLLFDAGINGAEAARRLAAHKIDICGIDALIISHDHSDHIHYAGVYHRKFGIPLYLTPRTLQQAETKKEIGKLNNVNCFFAGGTLHFGGVSVRTIPTPHDGIDGSAFVVSSEGKRLGILTDLGHPFKELFQLISGLDAAFIESNYDPGMLSRGPYPAFLKKRIKGPEGHLSNVECAELLSSGARLQWACLAHLSEKNNNASVALKTHREIIGSDLPLHVASRSQPTRVLTI